MTEDHRHHHCDGDDTPDLHPRLRHGEQIVDQSGDHHQHAAEGEELQAEGLEDQHQREDAEPVPAKIPVDATQRDTIDAVVSIFETGHLPETDAYSKVTVLGDGAGISYGCHQATARSGALEAVIDEFYVRGGQLRLGNEHEPVSAETAKAIAARSARSPTPTVSREVRDLMHALEAAGHSPVMRAAQRHVFDRDYWLPAFAQGQELGLRYALSYLALYDLAIHSGLDRLAKQRPLFPELPPSRGGGATVCSTPRTARSTCPPTVRAAASGTPRSRAARRTRSA